VHTDPATNAAPPTAEATRLRRPTPASTAPAAVSPSAARSQRPAAPCRRVAAGSPIRDSMTRLATRSVTAPPTAIRRAGPAWSGGARARPAPPAAAAALPTKTTGSSPRASCQAGVAVSLSRTEV
jgi:hypothetical protein